MSPTVLAQKSNDLVTIAIEVKEPNKLIVEKRMQLPNLDDLRDSISIKISINGEKILVHL